MNQPLVWLNGGLLPLGQARVSPLDRGLLYGDGLFETLRGQEGLPLHLAQHLARLSASARELGLPLPDLDWAGALIGLLRANRLTRGAARIKIVLTRGEAPGPGLPPATAPTLLMTAEPYQPPSPEAYAKGWRLLTLEQGHAPPLARHKSLNYLWCLYARQQGLAAGADEVVLLGPSGEACETSAGSLVVFDGRGCWTPGGPWRLPGVTLGLVSRLLAQRGLPVEERPARPQDLRQAQAIWVLNSLLGVMPAAELDGQALPGAQAGLAGEIRERLLGRDV